MEWLFITGIVTAVVAFWNQAKALVFQVYGRVVVTIEADDMAAVAILAYLRMHSQVSRFGLRSYRGWLDFVRPEGRKMVVASEALGKGTRVYWFGNRPLWVQRTTNTGNPGTEQQHINYRPVSVSFFRGTFDEDDLVSTAVDQYNALNGSPQNDQHDRHRIIFISGTDGKPAQFTGRDGIARADGCSPSNAEKSNMNLLEHRLLKWKHAEIGPLVYDGSSLDRMFLCPEAARVVSEIKAWLKSRDWHRDHGVPWKRGFGLTGVPGTGKTTFVRSIGEDFDLPIFVFDLATLYNDELRNEWQRVQAQTPCIVLFDDVDAVFQDRVNEHSSLTFDCFLNCLDGVSRSDGILTFITTNRPEMLSTALTRPGRIDRLVEMLAPDEGGRLKIASRILSDWPKAIARVVREGKDDSGAEFERRCSDLAMELFWQRAEKVRKYALGKG